ncbi:MAG: type 4a pilus biogenesis protein PilO [Deltaproteobacteria bacterium]|nr:type 4a pilus biogenesis protein PilO [Deltaproteobacteria bacterium]
MNIKDIQARFDKLSKREKMLSLGTAAVLAFLLADFLVARPLYDSYVSLKERTVEEEKKLEQNMINITMKEDIGKRFEEYRKFIRKPSGKGEEAAMMLSEIEKTARANEVTLADMKPQEGKVREFYKEYTVDIDAETELPQLIRFLHQVETSSQLMRVVKAKLSAKDKESPVVKAKLTVTKIVMEE